MAAAGPLLGIDAHRAAAPSPPPGWM